MGVAVHRIALPDHLVSGGLHLLDDRGQHVADLVVAHPGHQGEPAGDVGGVETLDVFDRKLRRHRRADLDPDRVGDHLGERDVRAVELAGALTDPQEVRRQVVQDRVVAAVQSALLSPIGINIPIPVLSLPCVMLLSYVVLRDGFVGVAPTAFNKVFEVIDQ